MTTFLEQTQRGFTLVTALVLLLILTLLALSAMRSSIADMRIVGNVQTSEEAAAAAQQMIEQVISSNFTASPVAATAVVGSYQVTVPVPACNGSTPILNSSLDPTNPDDLPCFSSDSASNSGIYFVSGAAATTTLSWCYSQKWDVQARVNDKRTGVSETTHQGVALKVAAGTDCPV